MIIRKARSAWWLPAFRFPGEAMPRQGAPAFGADTDTVLEELGYDADRIATLRAAGVI